MVLQEKHVEKTKSRKKKSRVSSYWDAWCAVSPEELDRLRAAGSQEDSDGKNGKVWASLFRSGHVQSKFISITGNGMLQQALQSLLLMPPSQADGDTALYSSQLCPVKRRRGRSEN